MAGAETDVIDSTERSDDLDALGVQAVEVREYSPGRNAAIAVVGLVLVVAALVPLAAGAVWAGSIVYAAVLAFLSGGTGLEPAGTAV
jgi:hypothetical protein